MSSSRHLGRIIVFQTLFAYEFRSIQRENNNSDPEAILEYVSREFEGKISDLSFAYGLLNGVLHYLPESRAVIGKYAPEWPVEKISPIDRAVLEIGIFEMLHSKDVPAVVAIDEAIELAKTFGNVSSQKFINGVLNAILEDNPKSLTNRRSAKS